MNPRITITSGFMTVRAPGYPDAAVDSWVEAIELIRHTFHVAELVVGVEQAGRRFLYAVTPENVATAAPDASPSIFVRSAPWTVEAHELSANPAYSADRDSAFELAVQALPFLADNPAAVAGIVIDGHGNRHDVTVTTKGVHDGAMAKAEPDMTETAAVNSQDLPMIDDDFLNGDASVSEDGLFDSDVSVWIDDGVDDNEIIRSRMSDRPRGRKAVTGLIVAAVAIVGLMSTGIAVGVQVVGGKDEKETTAQPSGFTKTVAGFSADKLSTEWSRGVGVRSRVGGTPDGKFVATVSGDDVLTVSAEATGDEVSALPLPGIPDIGPRGSIIDGKQAIIAQSGNTVTVWRHKAKAYTVDLSDLDTESVITFTGAEPLVATVDGKRTWRFGDGKLESWAKIPDRMRPYAMLDNGQVATGATDPYRIEFFDKAGKSKKKVGLKAPKGGKEIQRWIRVTDHYALLAWKTKGNIVSVSVNDVATGEVLASEDFTESSLKDSSAITSDNSDMIAFPGGLVVPTADNGKPKLYKVNGFVPSSISGQYTYGRDKSGARAMVDAEGNLSTLTSDQTIPWLVTASGIAVALDDNTAYALKPDLGLPTSKPTESEAPADSEGTDDKSKG
ncbi:hypothetical protein GCM10009689_18410 [Brevibacterium antiquum]|uniref:hypothetical protein n=1 Tax=Brevibacterium antiquum TaxID=234835 RepID=UPI0018DF4D43|nr:hypothetical protein [Brevibacterium antiquum]